MKDYPSIPRSAGASFREFDAYIFDKLDGSNLRSEWSKKRGWYKHGRRRGLLDASNPTLNAEMPDLFFRLLAEPLERIARDKRWQHLVVFYEFWGPSSIAGLHDPEEDKTLTVFDAVPDKKGFLGPKEFLRCFDKQVETPAFLGIHRWTRGFVEEVRRGGIEGITFEGVVGKAGEKHKIIRAKAKTQAWIDRVLEVHGAEEGRKIADS